MAVNDLASGATYGPLVPQQLLAGDTPVKTDAGAAAADITKYQLCALLAAGTVTPFIVGTHTAAQAVLAMQPALTGQQCPYAYQITVNDALVSWPAGAAIDSYAKRRAYFTGLFRVGKLIG
jgi:hypothetical protein